MSFIRSVVSATFATAAAAAVLPSSSRAQTAAAGEKIDYATLARIKEEGLQRSQVMEHIS